MLLSICDRFWKQHLRAAFNLPASVRKQRSLSSTSRPGLFLKTHRCIDPQLHNRFQMVLEGCSGLYAPEEISYLLEEEEGRGGGEGGPVLHLSSWGSLTAGAVLLPSRTLISNGARQWEHTSKPPCETSFWGKTFVLVSQLHHSFHLCVFNI